MVPDKAGLSVTDSLDFSQGHLWEGQADTYTVNVHTLKHQEFFCFTLNLIFWGGKGS